MMKKLRVYFLSAVLAVASTGCSSGSTSDVDPIAEYGCDTLNVYNVGEYIDPQTLTDFENAYNVTISYSLFDSNEAMYTRLLSGASYDVIVPSDYMIQRLIEEDYLQPLDKDVVTNIDLLDPDYLDLDFDPGNVYSVPYMVGSVGILYNSANVDSATVEAEGWDVFIDEQFSGRVAMYDSERDAFMVAFKALGYSMNTEDEDEIEEAYQWLLTMNENVDPAYVTDEVIDAMIGSEYDIALVYSGDATYIISENPDMVYYEPEQGTNVWSDGMVIPANAACPALANEFINYMSSTEVSYNNSAYVGYTSANLEAREQVASEVYEGIDAYIPRSGYSLDETFVHNETLKEALADLWIRVKSS